MKMIIKKIVRLRVATSERRWWH